MRKIEKDIYDEIQRLEEIADNLKTDVEFIFDENVDNETKIEAYKSSYALLNNDIKEAINNLNYLINDYSKGKGE